MGEGLPASEPRKSSPSSSHTQLRGLRKGNHLSGKDLLRHRIARGMERRRRSDRSYTRCGEPSVPRSPNIRFSAVKVFENPEIEIVLSFIPSIDPGLM